MRQLLPSQDPRPAGSLPSWGTSDSNYTVVVFCFFGLIFKGDGENEKGKKQSNIFQ